MLHPLTGFTHQQATLIISLHSSLAYTHQEATRIKGTTSYTLQESGPISNLSYYKSAAWIYQQGTLNINLSRQQATHPNC